jgi:hypothetical protein
MLTGPSLSGKPPGQGSAESRHVPIQLRRLPELLHPPENDLLYRPVLPDDPEVQALAESIRRRGVIEPLVVTLDDYILSGNRRAVASRLAGLAEVPCRVEPITRGHPDFLRLLREYNLQRVKTADELAREEVVVAPGDAYRRVLEHRAAAARGGLEEVAVEIEGEARRSKISKAKRPFLDAALAVIGERRRFWPLTVRQVHYALLNDPPLRHASKPGSRYRNDLASYKAACDLLIRARFEGAVPWAAIDDPTRPVEAWDVHRSVSSFVRGQMEDFLIRYWRDLQQSQPRHIEVVGEKNTVANILRPVAAEFCVPLTLGRGYSSGTPRQRMVERLRTSGRDELVLLFLSDFDPEGEDIPQAFARSLRDEFGVGNITLVKVALTAEQVEEMRLPPIMEAKAKSSRQRRFVERHGEAVHELEAIPPERMQQLLREAIERSMDADAYNAEQAAERRDCDALERIRRAAVRAIASSPDAALGTLPGGDGGPLDG